MFSAMRFFMADSRPVSPGWFGVFLFGCAAKPNADDVPPDLREDIGLPAETRALSREEAFWQSVASKRRGRPPLF